MTTLAISWDEWRACYDDWSVEDQQRFYDDVFAMCRAQQRFSPQHLGELFDHIGHPVMVGELGGWDGEFAQAMLAGPWEIERWTNYEICPAAVEDAVCDDPRYVPVLLGEWYWDTWHLEEVFVASHVLEHLKVADVRRTLAATQARWAYVQVPVGENGRGWAGYHGTHILEVGWEGLMAVFSTAGFELLPDLSNAGIRCFERRP